MQTVKENIPIQYVFIYMTIESPTNATSLLYCSRKTAIANIRYIKYVNLAQSFFKKVAL